MKQERQKVMVVIATHKPYRMPDASIYFPLHVGAAGKRDSNGKKMNFGYAQDDIGDNISEKNNSFCELTGLYWAWKNLDADYIGLVHYRRYFCVSVKNRDSFGNVLNDEEIGKLVPRYKVIVPKKRNYHIETLYSHYAHTHYAEHLDITREIVAQKYPEYLDNFDGVMKRKKGYMFNMMIMQRTLLDEYCSWLFDILFELEKKVDASQFSFYQGRFFGRVSEIIFNVWLAYQIETKRLSKKDIVELPCIYMEKIDWWKKVSSFLKAKFFHKKYEGSF